MQLLWIWIKRILAIGIWEFIRRVGWKAITGVVALGVLTLVILVVLFILLLGLIF